jgi:hypothetical protein
VSLTPKAMLLLKQMIDEREINGNVSAVGFEQAEQELSNLGNELNARLQRIARGE